MLALEVLIQQYLLHRLCTSILQHHTHKCHSGALLHHNGIMHCLKRILSPAERSMAVYQHPRHTVWINIFLLEGLHDYMSGFQLIFSMDFRLTHLSCTGDISIKIIRLRRSQRRDRFTCLCKCRSPAGMRMHSSSDIWEVLIKLKMCHQITARL